ncbi:MAG: hypothetical protein V4692_04695 [Bdellovibrionota bacterium]
MIALILLFLSTAFANDSSDQFSIWESRHNPKSAYGTKTNLTSGEFDISFRDIPHIEFRADNPELKRVGSYMDWIRGAHLGPNLFVVDFASYLPKYIRDSLLFEKNGEKWVRWPLSPFDTEFNLILERYLIDQKVPYERGSYFQGRSTSSRSILLKDPVTGGEFSFKTATNATVHGNHSFQYRPYPVRWGHINRRLSDYYYQMRSKLKYLDIAWEAAFLGLPPVMNSDGKLVDSSMTVRLMENVSKDKRYHMSGFVFNDPKEIARLARKAGVTPKKFVDQASMALGRGIAELNLVLGFVFTSAHLQNVRFEMDKHHRLTGRIILLDLSDGRPIQAIFEANGQRELIEDWKFLVNGSNPIYTKADWDQDDNRWLVPFNKDKVARGMRERMREITTIPESKIKDIAPLHSGHLNMWGVFKTPEALVQELTKVRNCTAVIGN